MVPPRSAASVAMWSCGHGTPRTAVALAIGVMTVMPKHGRREELRHNWPAHGGVAACFVVSRWLKDSTEGVVRRHGQTAIDVDSPDMLVLDGNSSEIEGGTAAFKMLPWLRHALAAFPDVAYVSRADDDAYLELPLLMVS